MTVQNTTGRVALIGAGPGDAELITLKGARLLGEADVVIYDNLVSPGVMDLVAPTAERIFVGKMAGNHTLPQEEICELLVAKARKASALPVSRAAIRSSSGAVARKWTC